MSCNDKAKTLVGEKFHPMSTGYRQRIGSIVPVNQEFKSTQFLDHDSSKASLVPSFELDVIISNLREKNI